MHQQKTLQTIGRFDRLVSDPQLGESAIALATIAAPLMASGESVERAVEIARSIVKQAEECLTMELLNEKFESHNHLKYPPVSLGDMKKKLGLHRFRGVKDYLKRVFPDTTEMKQIWESAKRGEKVFTGDLQEKILKAQSAGWSMRSVKSAQAKQQKKKKA